MRTSYLNRTANFYAGTGEREQGRRQEGELQNDYSIYGLGLNLLYGTPPPAMLYSRRVPQKYVDGTEKKDYLAGEAVWMPQSGSVFRKLGIPGPFYNSYEEYNQDVRLMGQEKSLVPEFRISQYIEQIVEDATGNHGVDQDNAIGFSAAMRKIRLDCFSLLLAPYIMNLRAMCPLAVPSLELMEIQIL